MKKGFFVPFLALILVLFARQLAFSDMANKYISFQGRIVDANSQPLADGNYSIVFKLCETEAGACTLWSETQPTVSVTNGLFSVLLGSVTTLDPADFNQDCWLTFNVNAGPDYSPRQKIGVSAYALNIADLQVTTGKIAPGTAGQILMSNATPATTWTSMSGDATINATGSVTIAADSVALGTDTTGNYAGSNAEGGSATNAFACSGDTTCEIQTTVQSISNNSITIDALNTGAASTITLTNSNATYAANVNVADGALQVGGTSVIDSSRNVANVVNLTNTGDTTIGNAGTDLFTISPNTMNLTGNVGKTIDVGTGALDTTLTVTNSGAGTANLSVEGSVTATSFSGSASNALACSGDATCEANAITVTNDVTVSSGSVTVSTGNLSLSLGNVIIAGTVTTGIGATEIYQMNQAVRDTDAVIFATVDTGQGANELYDMDQNVLQSSNVQFGNINSTPIGQTTAAAGSFTTLSSTGNTTIGNATGDLLNVFPAIFDWNDVDENKTMYVGSTAADRTLTLQNPDAIGKANLTVEGTVTAFAFTGSSTNALACSGDATCEIQSGIQSISNNSITIDALNTGANSTVTITNSSAFTAGLTVESGLTVSAGTVSLPNDQINPAEFAQGTAGQILMSNATPDTTWTTMSGDATISGAGALTIAADAVALTTDTTGDYVASVSGTSPISASGTGEGAAVSISCPTCVVSSGSSIMTLAGTSGTNQAISTGDTLLVEAGTNITTTGAATDKVTVATVANPTFSTSVTSPTFTNSSNITIDAANAAATTVTVTNSLAGAASLSVEAGVTAGNGLTVSSGTVSLPNDQINPAEFAQGTSGQILMSNATPDTTWTTMSGDATISGAGALTIANDAVTAAKISQGTAGQILMSNATPDTAWTTMSGDATISGAGALAIAADAVVLGTDTTGNYAGSNAEGGSATNAFACSGDATCEIDTAITTSADRTMPKIVLDSTSAGDNWTAQGAYISLGESGDLGAASLHMTYRGDGYGFIGSGAVVNAEPGASYLRFSYNTDNIYTPDTLTVGALVSSGNATIGDDLQIRTDDSATDPGIPWMRSNNNYLVINPSAGGNLYLSWDLANTTYVGGGLSISQGALSDSSVVSADIADETIATADIADNAICYRQDYTASCGEPCYVSCTSGYVLTNSFDTSGYYNTGSIPTVGFMICCWRGD